jgi:acyl-coenzyme A thioesterase PaaI-like protein
MLEDVRVSTFIDLSRADTRAGVQQIGAMLEAQGVVPAGWAATVLDTPVQAHEVPLL